MKHDITIDQNRHAESIYSSHNPKKKDYVSQESVAGKKDPVTRRAIIFRLAIFILMLILGGTLIANRIVRDRTDKNAEQDVALKEERAVATVSSESFISLATPQSNFLLHDFTDFTPKEIPVDDHVILDINWVQQAAWHLAQGQRLYRWEEWIDALREYEKVERIIPDLPGLHEQMGLCHFRLKDYAAASDYFEKALKLKPDSAGILNNLSLIHIFKGEYEQAEQDLHKAINVDKDYHPAYFNLGLALYRDGDMNAAANTFRDFLVFEPDNENAINLFVKALMKADRWNEAVIVLQSSLIFMPNAVPLHFGLAEALVRSGEDDKAMRALEKAISLTDAKSGLTWLSQGNYDPLRDRSDFQNILMQLNQAL